MRDREGSASSKSRRRRLGPVCVLLKTRCSACAAASLSEGAMPDSKSGKVIDHSRRQEQPARHHVVERSSQVVLFAVVRSGEEWKTSERSCLAEERLIRVAGSAKKSASKRAHARPTQAVCVSVAHSKASSRRRKWRNCMLLGAEAPRVAVPSTKGPTV